jgi:fatty acid amide hydrolase 2
MHRLLTQSGTELAAMIRRGETSSEEVLERHLEHAVAVNPGLNAIVRMRLREARAEARAADRALRERGPDGVGPFHGVPCTIKESFQLAGMPQTSGLVARRDRVSTEDAPTVARLRAAGAIPIGVTNVSELLMWLESNNQVYGRSNNPYDPTRIVGGSSGGEGASVGAGMAPFGLGSDIGGSIRLPAFFNGVFGHKASRGLVPNTGQYPLAENEALGYLSTGPLARRAEDLMPLLRVLAGPDGECAACRPSQLGDPAAVQLSKLRVLDVSDNGFTPVADSLRDAQRRVGRALVAAGASLEPRRIPRLKRSLLYWSSAMSASGGKSFGELLGEGERKRVGPELVRWALGRSPHTLPALALAAIERIPEALPDRTSEIVRDAAALRDELEAMLGEDGVMLYPTYSRPAPKHNAPLFRPLDFVYTAVINVMGFPATQVPLGLDEQGVPLGLQVIAAHGNDHLTIAVAMHLERVFGGWVPPRFAA